MAFDAIKNNPVYNPHYWLVSAYINSDGDWRYFLRLNMTYLRRNDKVTDRDGAVLEFFSERSARSYIKERMVEFDKVFPNRYLNPKVYWRAVSPYKPYIGSKGNSEIHKPFPRTILSRFGRQVLNEVIEFVGRAPSEKRFNETDLILVWGVFLLKDVTVLRVLCDYLGEKGIKAETCMVDGHNAIVLKSDPC